MTISPEIPINNNNHNNQEYNSEHDNAGFAELQAAMANIGKIDDLPPEKEIKKSEEEEPEELEESLETDQEHENELEEEPEIIPKKEKKIWRETKRKYQLMAEKAQVMSELEKANRENAELRQMLEESLSSGTFHYGQSAAAELERAKELRRRALEEGNTEAEIESAIAIVNAVNKIKEIEKWSYTGNTKRPEISSSQPSQPVASTNNGYQYTEIQQEMAAEWLNDHPYLQPSSSKYNPTFAKQVLDYINRLDSNMARNGQENLYFSEEYFNTIDNYITTLKKGAGKAAKTAESAAHVGGVRNSYSSSSTGNRGSSKQMVLSSDEKNLIANLGITEESYIKHKLADLKNNSERGR